MKYKMIIKEYSSFSFDVNKLMVDEANKKIMTPRGDFTSAKRYGIEIYVPDKFWWVGRRP